MQQVGHCVRVGGNSPQQFVVTQIYALQDLPLALLVPRVEECALSRLRLV